MKQSANRVRRYVPPRRRLYLKRQNSSCSVFMSFNLFHGYVFTYLFLRYMVLLRTLATFTIDSHSSLLFTVGLHRDIFGTCKSFSASSRYLSLGLPSSQFVSDVTKYSLKATNISCPINKYRYVNVFKFVSHYQDLFHSHQYTLKIFVCALSSCDSGDLFLSLFVSECE
jgi:hypothetical protein